MVAVLDPTSENTQVILLHNVSWETYERLIEEQGENPNPHFTYDKGDLEIMVLSYEHETINRLIAAIFSTIAMEIGVDFCHAGSTTFKHKDHAKGFEPDSSFYIKNEPLVRGKKRIDLSKDPPPDLVIEIDIAHSSLDKMNLYATLGIPEIWRYDGERISFHYLIEGEYQEQKTSVALPDITSEVATQFIENSHNQPHSSLLRSVREWAQSHKP